jgi:hypothetical protein
MLTYTAGDEPGKSATAQLKSTSKRGIRTLVLTFKTAGPELKLQLNGTIKIVGNPFTYAGTVSIGPAEFRSSDGSTRKASAPTDVSIRLTGGLPFNCEIAFTGAGTTGLSATLEKRGDTSVWVVKSDPTGGRETLAGSTCLGLAGSIGAAPAAEATARRSS